MRQGRAHFGNGRNKPQIHDGDNGAGDEHAAPAAGHETKIPAREMARDHRADAECPEAPDAGVALEPSLFEIRLVSCRISDTPNLLGISHRPVPLVMLNLLTPAYPVRACCCASRAAWRLRARRSAQRSTPSVERISLLRISIMVASSPRPSPCFSSVSVTPLSAA